MSVFMLPVCVLYFHPAVSTAISWPSEVSTLCGGTAGEEAFMNLTLSNAWTTVDDVPVVSLCVVDGSHGVFVVTSSGDQAVRLYTRRGECVGVFGQSAAWKLRSPGTYACVLPTKPETDSMDCNWFIAESPMNIGAAALARSVAEDAASSVVSDKPTPAHRDGDGDGDGKGDGGGDGGGDGDGDGDGDVQSFPHPHLEYDPAMANLLLALNGVKSGQVVDPASGLYVSCFSERGKAVIDKLSQLASVNHLLKNVYAEEEEEKADQRPIHRMNSMSKATQEQLSQVHVRRESIHGKTFLVTG